MPTTTSTQAPRPAPPSLPRRLRNYYHLASDWVRHRRHMAEVRAHDLLGVHRIDPTNLGDLMCTPRLYCEAVAACFPTDLQLCSDPRAFAGKRVVLGGGGLISPFFRRGLDAILDGRPRLLIGWGVGVNVHGADAFTPDPRLDRFDLLGLRDHGTPYEWVPCVSCLHPSLERDVPITHEVVLYDHHYHGVPFDPAIPRLTNDCMDFDRVVDFLGSASLVLTTSFHGAYWATLLGRRVIVLNAYSNRFRTMKHQPTLATTDTWRSRVAEARAFPEALSECRAVNLAFAAKVQELLESRAGPVASGRA